MTLVTIEKKKCACCNKIVAYDNLASCSVLGYGDLDFRKNISLGGIVLDNEIEECPHCGYISTDIRYKTKEFDSFFSSELYGFYKDEWIGINRTIQRFIKYAFFEEWRGNLDNAYRFYIKAAWKYDDLEDPKSAWQCRSRAISLLKKIRNKSSKQILEMCDLYRRTEQFEEAIKVLDSFSESFYIEDEIEMKIVKYQIYLCSWKDPSRHCVEEALWYE